VSVKYNIAHAVGRFIFDLPARKLTLSVLATKMDESGRKIEQHLAKVEGVYANYEVLAHIIGIERWGQQRLRSVLGEPLVMDEYDAYRPSIALFWDDLREEFKKTRQETLALVRTLERVGVDDTTAVRHNELGIITVAGWLRYLDMHANLECNKKIK